MSIDRFKEPDAWCPYIDPDADIAAKCDECGEKKNDL